MNLQSLSFLKKLPSSCKNFKRLISALERSSAELETSILNDIENDKFKPRHQPGVMKHAPASLPIGIQKSIKSLLNRDFPKKQIMKEALFFQRYMIARKMPIKQKEYFEKRAETLKEVQNSFPIMKEFDSLTDVDKGKWNIKIDNKVSEKLKKSIYSWARIDYTYHMSLIYAVARGAAEYSVLLKIFHEIQSRSNFVPKSIFDFGSGVGTVIWAANSVWGNKIKEYYCVDSSSEVINLSEEIIKNSNPELIKNIFYRQFLPASNDITSDIVVSAYSLLELPTEEQRLETILSLWKKTNKFLVIVECGSKGGFQVMNEIRTNLLSRMDDNDSSIMSHIFAPCPHEFSCPRAESKCYFEASYSCFPEKPTVDKREHYSYLVFQKGERSKDDKQWPRIVQPVLRRSSHVVCRMCSKSGGLNEVIFTRFKQGKIAYKCATASKWGDVFPIKIKPYEDNQDDVKKTKNELDTI